VFNTTRNQKERAGKLLLLYASEAQEVDELPFGSVGVILGLKYTRTGDTLVGSRGTGEDGTPMAHIVAPPAVMSASVIPQSNSDTQPVQDALEALSRTDPSVRVEQHEGQLLVHGLGSLHLEIVERRLHDEWAVNFEFGSRRVSFREGAGATSPDPEESMWTTDVSGKPVQLHLTLAVRPLAADEPGDDAWDGNVVIGPSKSPLPGVDASADSTTPLAHIARGLATTLSNSPHTALAVSRARIEVLAFKYPTHINPAALAGAAATILRERLRAAGRGPVMEPYVRLRIVVHEDSLGKVVKDLTENGGEVLDLEGSGAGGEDEFGGFPEEGVYMPPDWLSPSSAASAASGANVTLRRTIQAVAPLSKLLDYSNRLRALSGGHGQFEMSVAGFREVSDARTLEILREIGRA
jgi:elongation factor G